MELPLKIRSIAEFTDDMFFDLCQANAQLFLERDSDGNIIRSTGFVETKVGEKNIIEWEGVFEGIDRGSSLLK